MLPPFDRCFLESLGGIRTLFISSHPKKNGPEALPWHRGRLTERKALLSNPELQPLSEIINVRQASKLKSEELTALRPPKDDSSTSVQPGSGK